MKFLANENFPQPSVKLIRQSGIEIFSIAEKNPGIFAIVVVFTNDTLIHLIANKYEV